VPFMQSGILDRAMRMKKTDLRPPEPGIGEVNFGDLRRLTPIGKDWGFDRGKPVDRYYVEEFLSAHKNDIRGRVLEIGDPNYTLRFGRERVTKSDVLDIKPDNPKATIHAELTYAPEIPSDAFDCILLIQTLHMVYVRGSLRLIHRILKPGGVLLASFPGITRIETGGETGNKWYWSFTTMSAREVFGEISRAWTVELNSRGNVLAAAAFLFGLGAAELTPDELAHHDPNFELLITARAIKSQ
jgi:SAM-dependent methyltransferase